MAWSLTKSGVPEVVDDNGVKVCSLPMIAGEPANKAHAALICVAPELLAALTELNARISASEELTELMGDLSFARWAIEQAESAGEP